MTTNVWKFLWNYLSKLKILFFSVLSAVVLAEFFTLNRLPNQIPQNRKVKPMTINYNTESKLEVFNIGKKYKNRPVYPYCYVERFSTIC